MTEQQVRGRKVDSETPSCDRRSLLRRAGLATGIGVAGALCLPVVSGETAHAADEGPFLLGATNSPNGLTLLEAGISPDSLKVTGGGNGVIGVSLSTSGGAGLRGDAVHAGGVGVWGVNESGGVGVHGESDGVAVQGVTNSATGGIAVAGYADAGIGVYGQSNKTAIQGYTNSTDGHAGISGFAANAGGLAVFGFSPTTAIEGQTTGTNGEAGVFGLASSAGGRGVVGSGPSDGVFGQGATGVHGVGTATGGFFTSTGNDGVFGQGATNGVHGFVSAAGGAGVLGNASAATGVGVRGTATGGVGVKGSATATGGTGVLATAPAGARALEVDGVATFTRSGRATIPAGKTSVTVHGVALDAASTVLATLQRAAKGNGVSSAVPKPGTSSIVISLLRAPVVPLPVAWFVLN
ncbi:MAG: hypothetical protein QOI15_805 [Pseudonocardiales bacterium]|jgi:hypothetical protein|nr:hypothetical protein [Pseudonocardiales bacterium]MDT4941395.1 hypothetical protein [Pseudonocardiales bacterium]